MQTIIPNKIPFLALALSGLSGLLALADDHGGTLATATTISGPNTSGHLGADDLDWFKIVVNQPGRHWIYTTGNTDTRATLYNASGNYLSSDDDSGANYNFRYSDILQVGTYFLKIEDGANGTLTGSYSLAVRSPEFASNQTAPNRNASLAVLGDLDLYRIQPQKSGRNWLFTTGNTDTRMTIYNASGNYVTSDDDSGAAYNCRISDNLQTASYYLLVEHGGNGNLTGDYTLSWRSPCNAMAFHEANRSHSLGVLGDLDLFRVTPNPNGPVWYYTTGTTDTKATLYNDSGNYVTSDDDSGAAYNFLFSDRLAAGDYFLLVEHGGNGNLTGPYDIHQRDASRAIPLTGTSSKSASIGTYGDLDLYVFSSNGGAVSFNTSGTTDTEAILYDSGHNYITSDNNSGSGYNFSLSDSLNPGLHFLLVNGSDLSLDTGNYTLHATFNSGSLTGLSSAGTTINSSGSSSIDIVATGSWSLSNLPSWITASQTSGSGNASISLTYTKNLTGATREASITIGGQSYTVTQLPEGDTTGQPVPAQMSIAMGVIITVPTEPGISYRVETSDNASTWVDTGVTLQGDGTPQNLAFERTEARQFYRAVPQ